MSGSTDTGRRRVHHRNSTHLGAEHRRRVAAREKRQARLAPLPGYPKEEPFRTCEDADAYLKLDPLPCLLCGRSFDHMGAHLRRAHNISGQEYCDRYKVRFGTGLGSETYKRRMREKTMSHPDFEERVRRMLANASDNGKKGDKTKTRGFSALHTSARLTDHSLDISVGESPTAVCKQGHPVTPENTRTSRDGGTCCRLCHRTNAARHRERTR